MNDRVSVYWAAFLAACLATGTYIAGSTQGYKDGYAQRVFYEVQSCITKGYLCPSNK